MKVKKELFACSKNIQSRSKKAGLKLATLNMLQVPMMLLKNSILDQLTPHSVDLSLINFHVNDPLPVGRGA